MNKFKRFTTIVSIAGAANFAQAQPTEHIAKPQPATEQIADQSNKSVKQLLELESPFISFFNEIRNEYSYLNSHIQAFPVGSGVFAIKAIPLPTKLEEKQFKEGIISLEELEKRYPKYHKLVQIAVNYGGIIRFIPEGARLTRSDMERTKQKAADENIKLQFVEFIFDKELCRFTCK